MFNYAGANVYPANVRCVDDSDAPNSANFTAGLKDVADRTTYLSAHAILSTGGTILSGATLTVQAGATIDVFGTEIFESGALLELKSGSVLQADSGSTILLLSGAVQQVSGGATIALNGSGALEAGVASAAQSRAAGGFDSTVVGGFRLSGGATDFPTCNPARSRTLVQLLESPAVLESGWGRAALGFHGQVMLTGPATTTIQMLPLRLTHNGAKLATVTLVFGVTDPHAGGPPAGPLSIDVRRAAPFPSFGSNSLGGGTRAFPTPGTGAAWYAGGAEQEFVYNCTDASFNVIDNSQFVYYLWLTDESGANSVAGNLFYAVYLGYTNILDTRFSI